ncbi:RNase P/RNase MRP complex subunit Ecym_2329 [Eremothecium cymbalariae DBVPG|uniref:Ribonuclease P protein subunit n=1 Tax=Eremothecium cymbalariae (strain CBS 270.75 / DBVPG 7215 / KCTC 17166 / NRRL Y-17582) TaxID=931890 RepID=G8JQ66_ERECY|nr:Hypothetical protein Ecym_2329 [Eremothecium cymbalariae DBVPG\
MDRVQPFIKECILSKSFTDPSKPIHDKRLLDTLMLQPTDGGSGRRLRKRKVNLLDVSGSNMQVKQDNYSNINKNSKIALKEYINKSRVAGSYAKKIINEKNFKNREELETFLELNNQALRDSLPNYKQFEPTYKELWCNYIKELLDFKVTSDGNITMNGQVALQKLSMADYNGSLLKVTKSRNKNLEGIEGIVVWDAQKSFIMICEGKLVDTIKCIPKKGSTFTFEVPIDDDRSLQYSLIGDRFKYRSTDRAGRKFKSRRCDDLLYYVNQEG